MIPQITNKLRIYLNRNPGVQEEAKVHAQLFEELEQGKADMDSIIPE